MTETFYIVRIEGPQPPSELEVTEALIEFCDEQPPLQIETHPLDRDGAAEIWYG